MDSKELVKLGIYGVLGYFLIQAIIYASCAIFVIGGLVFLANVNH